MLRPAVVDSFVPARGALLAVVSGAVLAVLACRSTSIEPAAAHALESRELEAIMRQLENVETALAPEELDERRTGRQHRVRISVLAGGLASSAREIRTVLPSLGLAPDARLELERLSHRLSRQALAIERAAPTQTVAELRASVLDMRETCAACHSRFRPLPALPGRTGRLAPRSGGLESGLARAGRAPLR